MHSATLLLAALSAGQALAGPAHARFHRHAHAKRVDYDTSNVDWKAMDWNDILPESAWAEAYSKGLTTSTVAAAIAAPTTATVAPETTTAAPVTTTAAPAVAKVAAPSASSDSVSDDVSGLISGVTSGVVALFGGLTGLANGITELGNIENVSAADVSDGAPGNYGSPNGHNMMTVGSTDGQDRTITFENTSGEDMTIALWNNDFNGVPNQGQCLAATTPALTFAFAHGAKQVVAFGDYSYGGWAQVTSDHSGPCGMFNQVMGEFHMVSGSFGYDYSSIPSSAGANYDMVITAEGSSCTSDKSQNMWKGQDNNPENPVSVGSGSCYLPSETGHLYVTMGGRLS